MVYLLYLLVLFSIFFCLLGDFDTGTVDTGFADTGADNTDTGPVSISISVVLVLILLASSFFSIGIYIFTTDIVSGLFFFILLFSLGSISACAGT